MGQRDFASRVRRRAARAGLAVGEPLLTRLEAYYALLSRWNEKINLTSLTEPDEAIDRLVIEPLAAARHIPGGMSTLMDVGSGGGSPAIPLKLAMPDLRLAMVESKARKSAFLREAVRRLALQDVRVETARIEELLTQADLHEAFSLLTVRAVRVEARLLHTLQAFLAPGGHLLLFRGPGGPNAPAAVVPPMEFQVTVPLLESLQSRLTILVKRDIGHRPGVSAVSG